MRKWFQIALGIAVVAAAAAAGNAWMAMHREMHDMLTFNTFKSYTDEFHVIVLEVKSAPSSFTERVRVRCESDMEVGIEVVDLKETGIHEAQGTNGAIFYRLGNPYKTGQSEELHADGKFANCEIFYSVNTTLSNTIWHSKISIAATNASSHGDGMDTVLPIPMMVSGVQTNWPGAYQRGSWIPLATLGDYKIVVTVK